MGCGPTPLLGPRATNRTPQGLKKRKDQPLMRPPESPRLVVGVGIPAGSRQPQPSPTPPSPSPVILTGATRLFLARGLCVPGRGVEGSLPGVSPIEVTASPHLTANNTLVSSSLTNVSFLVYFPCL